MIITLYKKELKFFFYEIYILNKNIMLERASKANLESKLNVLK